MAIFTVKKDGSGTHTEIQSAIYDAASGDTIQVGAGTFSGNLELYKSVQIVGAGRDQTFITGSPLSIQVTGSFFSGEDLVDVASTASLQRGRAISGTYLATGSRVGEIVSATKFRLSAATPTTGVIVKTGCTWSAGASTITLPSATSVVVGMKVEGTGVNATVTAYNATTRLLTLSTPTTAAGSAQTLTFKPYRSGIPLTQPAQFVGSTFPATVQFMNVASDGIQLKKMTITGFDNTTPGSDASAIGFTNPASAGVHMNWLIEDCHIVADGDQAISSSPNLSSQNGVIQNCLFDGQTFNGSEPTEVPAFSSFTLNGCEVLSSTTIQVPNLLGIVDGTNGSVKSNITGTGIQSNTLVTGISGNVLTLSKSMTAAVGDLISCTFTNVQYCVPNVARQMISLGNSGSVTNCLNTTFKNNTVKGRTGAVISASGNKAMFNTAVTIDTVGGLIEGNVIDGQFGAGDPNALVSNFAIRSRGAGVLVKDNVNMITGGRGNSGFYVPNGTMLNNQTIANALVEPAQTQAGQPVNVNFQKELLKQEAKVSADPVFSVESNWRMVAFIYKHDQSAKRLTSGFKSFSQAKNMPLKGGMASGQKYQLHKIIISTSSRSLLVLSRAEITDAASFDVTLK